MLQTQYPYVDVCSALMKSDSVLNMGRGESSTMDVDELRRVDEVWMCLFGVGRRLLPVRLVQSNGAW